MRTLLSSRRLLSVGTLATLVATSRLLGAAAPDKLTTTAPNPVPLQDLDYSGDQSALLALDRELNTAGTDPKKLAALETRLLTLLQRPDGSLAARQAASQRLGLVLAAGSTPGPATLNLLQALLIDDRETDLARLALEPAPGGEVDRVLIAALATTTGRTRRGVLVTLAKRAPASAVPALRPLLADPDAPTAAAAAAALGQIGNAAALAALRSVPASAAIVDAQLAAARRLPPVEGLALLGELHRNTALPPHQHAAALRGLLDLEPATAATRIAEVLAGSDWTPKQAALESLLSLRPAGLVATLAAQLATWDSPTQVAALNAFARRAESAATPAVVTAVKSPDTGVRAAALNALGFLPGSTELVALLVPLAAGDNVDEAKLARASLARLGGPGVDAAILTGAEKSAANQRAVFIEAIAARNLTEALPFLRGCRQDADLALRTAAVGALGDLAPTSDQPLLLDWAATATDSGEQTRALRALVSLTLRDPDTAKRAQPIYAALERAAPATAVKLIPVLARLGGKESAECASRLAVSADASVADAATNVLTRWIDGSSQAPLVHVATSAPVASAKRSAALAAIRYFERNREVWTARETTLVGKLLDATTEPAARVSLVKLLNRAGDKDAAALAGKLSAEPGVAAAAKVAALCIAANRAGPPVAHASDSDGSAKNIVDGRTSTQWRVTLAADLSVNVDFRQSRPLHRLTLDQTGRTGDFPEKYEVYVTDDLAAPGSPAATGSGQRNRTIIDLPANTKGRYVILKNTAERPDGMWAICELFVD